MYQRILVCLDGSKRGMNVARAAADLAARYEASVLVLCVHDTEAAETLPDSALSAQSVINRCSEQLQKQAREAAQIFQRRNTPCDVWHRVGDPADVILQTAQTQNVDVIVMGNQEPAKWWDWLNNSVSARVARDAECTVLQVAELPQPMPHRSALVGGLGREAWGNAMHSD